MRQYSNCRGVVAKDNTMYYLHMDNTSGEYVIEQRLKDNTRKIFDIRSCDRKKMEVILSAFRDIHDQAYLLGLETQKELLNLK